MSSVVVQRPPASTPTGKLTAEARIRSVRYGESLAVRDVALPLVERRITALIGPSGCGKSTVLRCFNRMNDLVRGFRLEGQVLLGGEDVYAPDIDPVALRRHVGMVFQQPNPFASSVYKNVAFGLRINGLRDNESDRVETALRRAALWDEVKDKLRRSALALSGGQQQRLCIARAIAAEPNVLLMDEPCSALDPIATRRIEELMQELRSRYTIALVTHNLQQAQRVADETAFFYVDTSDGGRTGRLVERGPTETLFADPRQPETRQYLRGEFS